MNHHQIMIGDANRVLATVLIGTIPETIELLCIIATMILEILGHEIKINSYRFRLWEKDAKK